MEYLKSIQKKVGVIGYMVTWPPEEVNGVMISDRANIYHHYLSKDYSHPPFVRICSKSDFLNLIDINNDILLKIISRENGIEINSFIFDFVCHFINTDNFRANFANYLLVKQTFDFFLLYLQSPDPLSHYFWKYMFPEDFNVSDVSKEDLEKYKDMIADYYIYCDRVIGELLNKIDKDTAIIIVSDHGFKAQYENEFLFTKLNDLLQISGLAEIKKNSKKIIIRDDERNMWGHKKNIKISGNFPKEGFEKIREEIKEIFKKIVIAETDDQIFRFINDTDKGFVIEVNANYINKFPNHHILINNQKYKISEFLIKKPQSGNHDKYGIVILSGKNVKPNKQIESATVYDITPSVLYLMGLPIGKDMKGKILIEAIDDNYLRKHPIRYINSYETGKRKESQKPIRSPQEEEKIKEMMRSLGYIN